MPTQYDAPNFSSTYSTLFSSASQSQDQTPFALLEETQLEHYLRPLIQDRTVLDLACGTGLYSRLMLQWGARRVVGVDISSGMLDVARREAGELGVMKDGKLNFVLGDATDGGLDVNSLAKGDGEAEGDGGGGKFDVVTASWLLNYAPDKATMTAMWRTIARHLDPNGPGVFVGMGIQLPFGNKEEMNRVLKGEWAKYGCSGYVLREMDHEDGGFEVKIRLGFPAYGKEDVARGAEGGKEKDDYVEFDNYYLRNHVYEQSCLEGGMKGGLEWQPCVLGDEMVKRYPRGYWNEAMLSPYCRVCIARLREE